MKPFITFIFKKNTFGMNITIAFLFIPLILKKIGMPSSFAEIGAREEDIEKMTDKLLNGRKTEGNYVKLTRDDVIAIYRSAL